MMSVLEYAQDVNRTVEWVLEKCNELNIEVTSEEDLLDEDAIVILDNNLETDEEIEEAYEEKVIKQKTPAKKTKKENKKEEKPKEDLAKKKKEMYKNKEKLSGNAINENVVLYKENMTIGDLANELNVPSAEIIKKLFALGLMVNINSPISFENAEILIVDYGKELKKEKVVLYVPTFRTYDEYKIDELIQAFEESDYKLIIKIHPRMKIIVDKKYTYDAVTSLELLSIADVVISDYSAISIEAAILNRPVLLYIYDEERYNKIEGINTNLYEDLKGYVFKESEALVHTINKGNYDRNVLRAYREKYVVEQESATKALVDAILKDVK